MTTPWHDDDGFWEAFAPMMFGEARMREAVVDCDDLLALAAVKPPATVLDLCCGPGRHSVELAARGFTVTAVDRTASYLDRGRTRASKQDLELEWLRDDMRRFSRPESFDLAINLFTSFGYFDDPAEDLQVLTNLHASLRPGGVLVIELMSKEVLARQFRERDWLHLDDGRVILEERALDRDWSWIRNRWTLIDGAQQIESVVEHRLYSASELKALLAEAGFGEVHAHGDLSGAAYDHNAVRLVVVARRRAK